MTSLSDQQLDAKIADMHRMPAFPDRIEQLSRLFLGVPYQELPLGDWLYELKFDGYRAIAFRCARVSFSSTITRRR